MCSDNRAVGSTYHRRYVAVLASCRSCTTRHQRRLARARGQAHLDNAFAPGAAFTWETYNLTIVSTVYQVKPQRHTLWGGPSDGITGIHAWTFTPVEGGVRVDTEESWSGDPISADVTGMQAALDSSLTTWLDQLGAAAE